MKHQFRIRSAKKTCRVQFQRFSRRKALTKKTLRHSNLEKTEDDKKWDAVLATPESDLLLAMLARECREDIRKGRTIKGGFGDI